MGFRNSGRIASDRSGCGNSEKKERVKKLYNESNVVPENFKKDKNSVDCIPERVWDAKVPGNKKELL